MATGNPQDFIAAGMPESAAVELSLAVHAMWAADNALPDVNRLKAAGCSQMAAEDIAAGIANGFLHGVSLELQTSWPAAAFERINAVLIELMAERDARIARRMSKGKVA